QADQGDRDVRRQIAIINSMTPRERRHPGIIDGSRRRRIAAGSGVQVQDVNRLLKQFLEMQRVMKSMKGGALKRMMGAFKGGRPWGGGRPAGFRGRGAAGAPRPAGPRPGRPSRGSGLRKTGAGFEACVESALFFGRPFRGLPQLNESDTIMVTIRLTRRGARN